MTNDDFTDMAADMQFQEDDDIRRAALGFISDAWAEAIACGVDTDAVAHAAMFTALADLVSTYGEDAVAKLAEGLPERIQRGDYSVNRVLQ
ncbi:hypothetical protein GWI72_11485 [Microvirga tunisiensis]|uniref:Uncharacterized protein n=2 Tax=Pannonibacter tanglangensis TaxID=2750084 RepID=A0A7X5F3N9_9HYPH|nr:MULTISPECIES: hypothetical protein [unclassified Pannonibacter]NBN64354.1 hypothetical protein [Pannonibacter sp. XCT-34]NBN78889.1 hypothetical protein [Pannonibacter sp. XCT-53]